MNGILLVVVGVLGINCYYDSLRDKNTTSVSLFCRISQCPTTKKMNAEQLYKGTRGFYMLEIYFEPFMETC